MADRPVGEKAGEKNFFARTAKNTTKRAKRAQEKVKRKLGKSDETKDEIFDRFVENFNKQQDAVQRLQKELKNYLNCLKAMLNANQLFGEAVKQVYEPEWSGREKFVKLLDTLDHSWTNLVQQLQDEVLEPLTSYQMQFPDTKNRIAKRSRKVVDYDRHRHHLETLKVKGGKAGDPKKLSQAEEDYNQAKNAYLQLHSDLYDELPALYDSRISIYVSSFQSIFTLEGVFHRETAKIKTEMNDLLDVLAKETSDGAYSTRRPLSVISNVSSDGESSPAENGAKFYPSDSKTPKFDHTDENSENATSENEEVDGGDVDIIFPQQTATSAENMAEKPTSNSPNSETGGKEQRISPPRPPSPILTKSMDPPSLSSDGGANVVEDSKEKGEEDAKNSSQIETSTNETEDRGKEQTTEESGPEVYLPRVLFKVVATHPYTGEDDDELTFEKGDVIHVIPYQESDDPDDGWLLGVMEGSGVRGVFPENFTKKLEEWQTTDH